MSTFCERSELPVEQCAHCRTERPVAATPRLGPWFTAQYRDHCDGCDEEIEPGEQIRSDGEGGWLCSGCGS